MKSNHVLWLLLLGRAAVLAAPSSSPPSKSTPTPVGPLSSKAAPVSASPTDITGSTSSHASCWTDWPSDPASSLYYCSEVSTSAGAFTSGYSATVTKCPPTQTPLVRPASGLNSDEKNYMATHDKLVSQALPSYFSGAWKGAAQYNISLLMQSPPRIGMAISGGGLRATLMGAGVLQAFKSSGLLDSAQYIAGLSGGGWLVGTWALSDFVPIETLLSLWSLPSSAGGMLSAWQTNYTFCFPIQCETAGRGAAGAAISFADNYNRLISRYLLKNINPDMTWSDVAQLPAFSTGQPPFPLLVTTGETKQANGATPLMTSYEMSPFEFGSWDRETIAAFVKTRYMGSILYNGTSTNGQCLVGIDHASYTLGSTGLAITAYLQELLGFTIQESNNNLINPFCGFGTGTETVCDTSPNSYEILYLTDGGANDQTIPFLPLLQPDRNLDVIIAVDSAADTQVPNNQYNWPFASSLNFTNSYASSSKGQSQGVAFPNSTTLSSFTAANPQVNYGPTFYGCNPNDTTSLKGIPPPLIVYLPNNPYSNYTNASTLSTGTYPWTPVVSAVVGNGVGLATYGKPGAKLPWATCLACAVAERARLRTKQARSTDCNTCFADYCAENKTAVSGLFDSSGNYSPPPIAGATPGDGTYSYN